MGSREIAARLGVNLTETPVLRDPTKSVLRYPDGQLPTEFLDLS